MRALVVQPGPEYSVQDVHRGWVKGLRQVGCQVGEFNLNDRLAFYGAAKLERDGEYVQAFDTASACKLAVKGLEAACYEFWPDVVVIISGFFVDEPVVNLMRAHGHKVILVHTESPYEDDRQLERAQLADLNVLNDPTNIERFREVAPSVYLPHCFDPDIHFLRNPTPGFESEFCFVGTGYQSRIEFFEQVDFTGIDAKLAGNWKQVADDSSLLPLLTDVRGECCDNTDTATYYTSTQASANLYRREANDAATADGWSVGPREVELAACGTWFARSPRGESDELFPMLPTFTDPRELGGLIRWAITHEDEREDAALKASCAIEDRTFDANAVAALTQLGF